MTTKDEALKPWQDIADAAGILRAHNHMGLANRLLQHAEALAEQPAQQQEPVTERLMDCDDCGGTGVDGDVDDRGRTIDVQCRSCAGSGKSRYFRKCADGKRCLQGCLGTEGCYWENRAAKEQPAQQPATPTDSRSCSTATHATACCSH